MYTSCECETHWQIRTVFELSTHCTDVLCPLWTEINHLNDEGEVDLDDEKSYCASNTLEMAARNRPVCLSFSTSCKVLHLSCCHTCKNNFVTISVKKQFREKIVSPFSQFGRDLSQVGESKVLLEQSKNLIIGSSNRSPRHLTTPSSVCSCHVPVLWRPICCSGKAGIVLCKEIEGKHGTATQDFENGLTSSPGWCHLCPLDRPTWRFKNEN